MRRVIAALLRLVFPERQPQGPLSDAHWQVPTSSGRHAIRCVRYTPPPPLRQSPPMAVVMTRAKWLSVSSIIIWSSDSSPVLAELISKISTALIMTADTKGPATQWDLDITEFGRNGNE